MISAFGVEHGEVAKAFRKLEPKLQDADDKSMARTPQGKNQLLEDRFRENYAQWRLKAGRRGMAPQARRNARGDKAGAWAMVEGIGNMSRRAGRFLP